MKNRCRMKLQNVLLRRCYLGAYCTWLWTTDWLDFKALYLSMNTFLPMTLVWLCALIGRGRHVTRCLYTYMLAGKLEWRQCRLQTAIVHYSLWITESKQCIATLDGLNTNWRSYIPDPQYPDIYSYLINVPSFRFVESLKVTKSPAGLQMDTIWLRDEHAVRVYRQT